MHWTEMYIRQILNESFESKAEEATINGLFNFPIQEFNKRISIRTLVQSQDGEDVFYRAVARFHATLKNMDLDLKQSFDLALLKSKWLKVTE